jgi:hypothetical protein
MRAARVTVAFIVALTLTACGGGGETKKSPAKPDAAVETLPKAGHCYADEVQEQIGLTPDLTTKVECSKKHLFEVTGVVEIPSKYLRGGEPADRERLGDQEADGFFGSPWERFMDRSCAGAALEISGLSDLTINGRPGVDVLAAPIVASSYLEWSVTTDKQWRDGHRFGFCVLHFDESEDLEGGDDDGLTSATSAPLVKQILDPGMAARSRKCINFESDGAANAPCDQPHDAEEILTYDVDAVHGAKFAKSIDIEAELKDRHYIPMLDACEDAIQQFLGPFDSELYVDVLYGGWEWEDGRRRATCIMTTDEDHLLPGHSVVGQARKVELTPVEEARGA